MFFISTKFVFCHSEATMDAVLDLLQTKYGGVEGYLRSQCSFSGQDIERMKENLRTTPET